MMQAKDDVMPHHDYIHVSCQCSKRLTVGLFTSLLMHLDKSHNLHIVSFLSHSDRSIMFPKMDERGSSKKSSWQRQQQTTTTTSALRKVKQANKY